MRVKPCSNKSSQRQLSGDAEIRNDFERLASHRRPATTRFYSNEKTCAAWRDPPAFSSFAMRAFLSIGGRLTERR
jgi:hypothetical protein